MKWSKYTLLFASDRHGRLLYSALTNTFARVDEQTAVEIERIRRDPQGYDFTGNPGLYVQLVTAKALVEPGEEEDLIRVLRMQRLYENFDATRRRSRSCRPSPATSAAPTATRSSGGPCTWTSASRRGSSRF